MAQEKKYTMANTSLGLQFQSLLQARYGYFPDTYFPYYIWVSTSEPMG